MIGRIKHQPRLAASNKPKKPFTLDGIESAPMICLTTTLIILHLYWRLEPDKQQLAINPDVGNRKLMVAGRVSRVKSRRSNKVCKNHVIIQVFNIQH